MNIGHAGENLACRYLKTHGYRIIQQNYRIRGGEIDIVCHHHQTVVFVEVKTRQRLAQGPGRESITRRKQGRLRAAAENFLMTYPDWYQAVRFDVIDIVWPTNQPPRVTHLQDCIQSDS